MRMPFCYIALSAICALALGAAAIWCVRHSENGFGALASVGMFLFLVLTVELCLFKGEIQ